MVNFWATWCAPCTAEFPELQKIYRMYRKRPFDMVTVSINYPDEEKGVRRFLESQHATSRNLLSATMDPYELIKAFESNRFLLPQSVADAMAELSHGRLGMPLGEQCDELRRIRDSILLSARRDVEGNP